MGGKNSGRKYRYAERVEKKDTQSLYSLCDQVVRKALAPESTLTENEKAQLAIKVTVKRIPQVLAPPIEFSEFMSKLLTKGDMLGKT